MIDLGYRVKILVIQELVLFKHALLNTLRREQPERGHEGLTQVVTYLDMMAWSGSHGAPSRAFSKTTDCLLSLCMIVAS